MVINLRCVVPSGAVATDGTPPIEPFSQPVLWPRGTGGTIKMAFVDELGAPVNITGATVTFSVRRLDTDDVPALHVVAALTTPAAGLAAATLVATDTSTKAIDIYRHDVWITLAGVPTQAVPGSNFTIGEAIGP